MLLSAFLYLHAEENNIPRIPVQVSLLIFPYIDLSSNSKIFVQ